MKKFIENVNKHIDYYGIKQTAIALKSGIEKNKLSRLLGEKQKIKGNDMEKLASALGKDISYFLDDISIGEIKYDDSISIAFSMGEPTPEKVALANTVFDFLEHIDAIMGVSKKIKNYSRKGEYNGF